MSNICVKSHSYRPTHKHTHITERLLDTASKLAGKKANKDKKV